MWTMLGLDAVQDHVHDRNDVGEGFLFLAVKRALLRGAVLRGGALGMGLREIFQRLAQETRRTDRTVVDFLAGPGLHDLDDGADERARGVIFAAVAPGIAHVSILSS